VVNLHKKNGDRLIVITATNSFVARPIAQVYGIDELLATEPESRPLTKFYLNQIMQVPY
jgi:phosphoserine phosphatase